MSRSRRQVEDLSEMPQMRLHFAPIGDVKRLREHLAEAVGDRLFLGIDAADIRTAAAFEERVNAAWGKLGEVVREVGATAAVILAKRHEVHLKLARPSERAATVRERSESPSGGCASVSERSGVHAERETGTAPSRSRLVSHPELIAQAPAPVPLPDILQPSLNDMREQLDHLVPADFLLKTPPHWLAHIPRFLAGIEVRVAKLLDAGLERDSRGATAVFPFWKAWLERISDPSAGPPPPEWIEFRFLVEEYRISQFAQQLGTSARVSEKVLEERLATLLRVGP